MQPASVARIVRRETIELGLRRNYWRFLKQFTSLQRLLRPEQRDFRRVWTTKLLGLAPSLVRPIAGHTDEHAHAAARWLAVAQDATPDAGVSLGYFPLQSDTRAGWLPSYPETTGYIIQSLLEYAKLFSNQEMRERAERMGVWETEVQMQSGAVQGGPVCAPEQQSAAVFNTGMVLQGYTALLMDGASEPIASGARRAAEFLLRDQGQDGHFRTHGSFVSEARVKTYNVLCGWALQRYAALSGEREFELAAIRVAEAAVREQRPSGWFANNNLADPRIPLTHTIGYTLQGVLEIGAAVGRDDLVAAARRGLEPLLERVAENGFLHGAFYEDWVPACFSSCLTGSAQIAIVAYRMFELSGELHFREVADRLTDYLKALQLLESPEPALVGALAGSFPIYGRYMTEGYPNWATKYMLDALLHQRRHAP